MLHDSLTVEEVVDSESALEFMKEATKLATSADLEDSVSMGGAAAMRAAAFVRKASLKAA